MKSRALKIVPAILAKNGTEFRRQWRKIAPYFNYAQIDIMDGRLVSSKNNIRPSCLRGLSKNFSWEVHLMVKNVAERILPWAKTKGVRKIIWHIEAVGDPVANKKLIKLLETKKIKAGLAINPATPLKHLTEMIKLFDTIQIMGVAGGRQGQKFQSIALQKIKTLRKLCPQLNIAVDGGVNKRTAPAIKKAGANILGVGSYLQKATDIKQVMRRLKN